MTASIADRYKEHRDKLNYDTGHFSMVRKMVEHPSFKEILALGKEVIPIILQEFDRYIQLSDADSFPGWWSFNILRDLAGQDVSGGRPGYLNDWVKLWVKWGEENGHLAKDRPPYDKIPPIQYKGWVVVGQLRGQQCVLCPKRKPQNKVEEELGTAGWVTKIDASRLVDDGWWKKYAWILPTKEEAQMVLDLLHEKIKNGQCSEFNRPEKSWIEEL